MDVASHESSRAWNPTAEQGSDQVTAKGTLRRFFNQDISDFLLNKGFLIGNTIREGVRGERGTPSGWTGSALQEI